MRCEGHKITNQVYDVQCTALKRQWDKYFLILYLKHGKIRYQIIL